MIKKPTDAEIRGIVSSMRIEGFGSTYESVKANLTEFYKNYNPQKMTELVNEMNKPGADKFALLEKYLDETEASEEEPRRIQ